MIAAETLETGELEVAGVLPGASNGTFLARLGEKRVPVVYKPVRGEAPLWDFPPGTLALREVAAHRVSRVLGWPSIPPTVLRDGPLGRGAVQAYVAADPAHHVFTLRGDRGDDLRRVAAFDVIANNADRKGGHVLLDEEGTIWSIDHGLCFHDEPKLRTVIWDFAGEPLPPELLEDVARVVAELRDGPLREELGELLRPEEVEATTRRGEALRDSGRFPEPGPGRAVPWPPV